MRSLPEGSKVADVGCFGWTLADECGRLGHELWGLDREEPPKKPASSKFAKMVGSTLMLPDHSVDFAVASHVIEHLQDPVALGAEMARILVPGGLAWFEAPSELSCIPPSSEDSEDHRFENFWDEPTHVRPHTPGSMYRLLLSSGLFPLACGRVDEGIPSSRAMGRKPMAVGLARPRFLSLKDCPYGSLKAWEHVWPEVALEDADTAPWVEK